MNIEAKITGIKYQVYCKSILKTCFFEEFDINKSPSSFLLSYDNNNYGVSKWISPKRTRSYPFERVYNTYSTTKKIAIIPVIKDEGADGDRDFIQWDTLSLMSLLDVYVVLAYYNNASKHRHRSNKISSQKFDNSFVKSKIMELNNYRSSALHWNLKEINDNLPSLIENVQESYARISQTLNIKLHSTDGIDRFKDYFKNGVEEFMNTSRSKAIQAQSREVVVSQPKEYLSAVSKAKITIRNYLGGVYYFTTDEVKQDGKDLYLIESKHSKNNVLPAVTDIKDGLLKMVLYSNLKEVTVDKQVLVPKPVLMLTSEKLTGYISSTEGLNAMEEFINLNLMNRKNTILVNDLFLEAFENGFELRIKGV